MRTFSGYKTLGLAVSVLIAGALLLPAVSLATGPRVTPGLFVATESEIFAAEQPPFISAIMAEPGLVSAIADAALKTGEIQAVITTLPLRRMVKYHLVQEHAIAALGSQFNFSDAESTDLILVPLFVSPVHYLYYKPAQKTALTWDGALKSLRGYRFSTDSHPSPLPSSAAECRSRHRRSAR